MDKKIKVKQISCKLIDFRIIDKYNDESVFYIQMFGINEKRKSFSILIKDFKPFFYIKIPNHWKSNIIDEFMINIKEQIGYSGKYINDYSIVKKHKLYGFDAYKEHNFIKINCENNFPIYKIKDLYYDKERQFIFKDGYIFNDESTYIYEVQIPPMLRFFHIQNISPSGWIKILHYNKVSEKKTTCNVEIQCGYKNIVSLPNKETIVPYKICSFDIEASSSHGDFPIAIKNYCKVAYDIINYINIKNIDIHNLENELYKILQSVFGFMYNNEIDNVFLKNPKIMSEKHFNKCFNNFISKDIGIKNKNNIDYNNILDYLEKKTKFNDNDNDSEGLDNNEKDNSIDDENNTIYNKSKKIKSSKIKKNTTIINYIQDEEPSKIEKVGKLTELMNEIFPSIEGDKVTFIGSTFLNYQENEPYLNHCLVLGECEKSDVKDTIYDSCKNEKELLLKWKDIILKEDPDIIIGYNIFGFDYKFMYERAQENHCDIDFSQISRNIFTKPGLTESSIIIASGQHDLKYMDMPGRLQIDLYNYFRRDYNLDSYKLDNVAAEFLSDKISNIEYNEDSNETTIYTKNMKGLELNGFVRFKIMDHSGTLYNKGEKFRVIDINTNYFKINNNLDFDKKYKLKWSLAKDDVSPQDIFRLTNEGPKEKSIVAKYCIQDCNLVHHLFKKIDVMTTYIEMSKICSVPINFLVFRGQGIKLTSYIGKKCREKNTLMPLISKGNMNDAYEGAIVLEPKTGLYLDNPVACVDYSSLYPSSIISENLSHDSKVWTKELDLHGNLIKESGEKDDEGNYIYDNLPEYKYVDVKYETFGYKRLSANAKLTKIKTGYKICRFAQYNEGKAILPSILEELLAARKSTKKQMKNEKDPFMKNILDKRQLSIKVTANSLYGQCGAKTSTFYEIDIAASTTATGRKLLHYGKEIVENVYSNAKIETKYGTVITNAEYIYGDTDSVFFTFNLKDEKNNPIKGKKALELTIDLAKDAGQLATKFLKQPHDLEYEKTFFPFCLLAKKKYVGMLYEEDPDICFRKSMGIVLKRRDNAPIVKDVYGGIIDILMKEKDVKLAMNYLDNMLKKIINKDILMDKLIISKSLRAFYKDPKTIAHRVLADRIAERDPGNKPSPGDRIPYVYIVNNKKNAKQGEKIETPEFYKENPKLKIDYGFYISNQIMNPVLQLFSLVLYDMDKFQKSKRGFILKLNTLKQNLEKDKYIKKEQELKDKEVKKILFDEYLIKAKQNKMGIMDIKSFCS